MRLDVAFEMHEEDLFQVKFKIIVLLPRLSFGIFILVLAIMTDQNRPCITATHNKATTKEVLKLFAYLMRLIVLG